MKKIYKVGNEYFSDLTSAEIYSRKYYVSNRGYIQTISVDDIDVEKPIVVYIQWFIDLDNHTLSNYGIYKENDYFKQQYSDIRLNTIKVDFIRNLYCDAFGKFEFPTLRQAYKYIKSYYNDMIIKVVEESLKDLIEDEVVLYLKI
jgi:hypothetical protein